jgi:hypothetical protein
MAPDQYVLDFLTREQMEKVEKRETEKDAGATASKPDLLPSLPRLEEEEIRKPWYRKILGR